MVLLSALDLEAARRRAVDNRRRSQPLSTSDLSIRRTVVLRKIEMPVTLEYSKKGLMMLLLTRSRRRCSSKASCLRTIRMRMAAGRRNSQSRSSSSSLTITSNRSTRSMPKLALGSTISTRNTSNRHCRPTSRLLSLNTTNL